MMVRFRDLKFGRTLLLAVSLGTLTLAGTSPVDVSSQVKVTHTGFGRNRTTGVWSATMTVTNSTGAPINGPLNVVFKNLTSGISMANKTGTYQNDPYLTVSAGTVAPGASVSVTIQFANPSNGFIDFTPSTYSGTF